MLKKINFILNIVIGSFIGFFIGHTIYAFWDYKALSDCDLMIFKGNIICYILLLKYPQTIENTKFVAGELSLVLYLPTGHYES